VVGHQLLQNRVELGGWSRRVGRVMQRHQALVHSKEGGESGQTQRTDQGLVKYPLLLLQAMQ